MINGTATQMLVTSAQIERVQSDAADIWTFGNSVLYQMCDENPSHTDVRVVAGKIWLIGRSYAAAIERRKTQDEAERLSTDLFYERRVVPAIVGSNIDERILAVRKYSELSNESLYSVLDAHGCLVKLFRGITGHDKRSLASKYLHFHAPAQVPIYDSIVTDRLSELLRDEPSAAIRLLRRQRSDLISNGFDQSYVDFVLRLLYLRNRIEEIHGVRLTPRQLDRLLLLAPQ